jgi:uncharacterized secreted repeat protein (TIGR03808 family)
MTFNRRALLATAGLGVGAALPVATQAAGPKRADPVNSGAANAVDLGVVPNTGTDQSRALQAAIDRAAERGVALSLAAGRYEVRNVQIRPRSILTGAAGRVVLSLSGDGPLLVGEGADGARIEHLAIDDGGRLPLPAAGTAQAGLVVLSRAHGVYLASLTVGPSRANGIVLDRVSGRVENCTLRAAMDAALFSIDAEGLEISHNRVSDCANNGILIWRTRAGEDGTVVANNRIERIRAENGGSGQYGNGINVFRAGSVLVTGNRITDCAYTAIRGNAASNVQMIANSCQRLGEVALYAEFGFEGAVIASNIVDDAATGISVTNFNEGGRLAVVQGNLIRNLKRREHEPEDKRGEGIGIEADAVVTGNTIEAAPTAGIVVGWGRYMREVVVTSNVIRKARVGIMITRDPEAGAALIAQNLISGTREGAIRAMDKGVLAGPDLARGGTQSSRIAISGNVAVDGAA